ncbi:MULTISPECIES: M48 family metalloprotease [unclassified Duganella]|uniref:M48 family metalloprotease n=1 Tax=unclassified Duganella TaxID=2636909 RepID=UPI00088063E3|nr:MULTISPECIES: M48 family metalloprotease [unclassified Duganella]SDH13446.1 Peptidase family M48 [Duganella sp. OV458]SDK28035.1 Peptidase family M48 [Duganella sp. OV510]
MRRAPRPKALLLAALLACRSIAQAEEPASEQAMPAVKLIGELPPAPAHQWSDLTVDLNDHRTAGNGLVSAPALSKYLNGLYTHIKIAAGVPDWPGAVHISSDTTLNAHASASGNIYLHMGLIRSAESEDEIYGVLAHEFAHIYLNHQAAYEAHQVASNAVTGAKVALLGIFQKKLPGTNPSWSAFDSLALVDGVVHDSLIPVWQRDVEEQADMFAATLSLRERYSYPSGYKAFLERLAALEQREQASQPFGAPEGGATPAAAPGTTRKTHATAREREEVLTAKMLPLMPRPRPAPRKAPWQAVVKDKETAEVLAHFALLPEIAKLQAAGRNADALKLAQVAASGATAGDGTMLLVLQGAMKRTGASIEEQRAVLLRNRSWPERSWSVQYQAAMLVTPEQQPFAKEFLQEQYAYFGEAPRTWPDMVGFYFRNGDKFSQLALSLKCTTEARFRDACVYNTQTDAQRQQAANQAANRQQQQLNKWEQKLKDKLKLNQ